MIPPFVPPSAGQGVCHAESVGISRNHPKGHALNRIAFILSFGFLTLTFVGCPTRTVLAPTDVADASLQIPDEAGADSEANNPDGVGVDNCSLACLNLRKPTVHCAAGFSVDGGEDCTKSCRHARDSRLMPLDIVCATKARTLQEAHVCKGWGC